jgi:hypothetical protein
MDSLRSLRHCLSLEACVLLLVACSPDPKTKLQEVTPQVDLAFLTCGSLGKACCTPPASAPQNPAALGPLVACQTGLGCDITTNTCVSPCGGAGQACCDGPETRATKWTKDGLPYSPNTWNMRDMCDAGACDRQSHRCFTCGTQEGHPCCPPDAAQATARCADDHLQCRWDDKGLYESGTCEACGSPGKQPCRWGCDPELGILDKFCAACGRDGQPRCDDGCQKGLGLVRGICRVCGGNGQIPCDFGCRVPFGLTGGLCGVCGGQGSPPCDSGCGPGMRLINGKCTFCGNVGQPPCAHGCGYELGVAGGVCRTCGTVGQIPCDVGCEAGLVISGGKCVPPPGAPPPIDCAGEGQACVADWISGPHCCKTGAPLLCNWGVKCEACVPHGEECRIGGPQLCCNAKDGDYCVLDPTIDKVICDIPDAPDKK